jgi:hypothetical protein
VTEQEWLSSTDLDALVETAASRVSWRKLLLFGCAVVGWRSLRPGGVAWAKLRAAERLADSGLIEGPGDEVQRPSPPDEGHARLADGLIAFPDRGEQPGPVAALRALIAEADEVFSGGRGCDGSRAVFEQDLVARLRDVVGNPFRPGAARPIWLAWSAGQVPHFAHALYDEGRFDELPYLADALEDAGCDDAELLAHLRGPGPHVRGCWALDIVLGKS